MIINFYKRGEANEPVFIKSLEVAGRVDDRDFARTVQINICEVAKEILGQPVTTAGLKSLRSCGDYWSSFKVRDGVPKSVLHIGGFREEIISAGAEEPGDVTIVWSSKPVTVDDVETDLVIGVDVFDTGYIVSSSADVRNILGGKRPAYFNKITSKYFKQGARSDAKVFKDEKALLKYMKEKREIFARMHAAEGYVFGYEKMSSLWDHEIKPDVKTALDELFDEINSFEEKVPTIRSYGEDDFEEAYMRMQELSLWTNIQKDFLKSGKLYMSEFGGVIYDLNEEAKEAVRRTSEYGLPYHVIRTNSAIGDMYAVLYVSKERSCWDAERFEAGSGIMHANVYNASMGLDEMGSIGVAPANGGLVRTA